VPRIGRAVACAWGDAGFTIRRVGANAARARAFAWRRRTALEIFRLCNTSYGTRYLVRGWDHDDPHRELSCGLPQLGRRTPIVGTIFMLFTAFVIRAAVRAYRRHGEVRMLRTTSRAPEARLALAASEAGIDVRRVISEHPVFCVVGLRKPVVLVSEPALERLSEAELQASLAHERAHARHFDQLLMALVAFFADVFPMPVDDLIERYRIAREFAADRAALRTVDSLDLAQAIYRLAVPAKGTFSAALAERGAAGRIRALLQPDIGHDRRIVRNLSLLIAGQGLVAVTLVALLLPLATCRMIV